jgi:hypothetical protein
MTLLLNRFDKDPARLAYRLGARSARGVAFTVALVASAAACGESTPGPTSGGSGGGAGQTTTGTAGMAVAGGTSNPTAGTPATSGAAGMPGSSGSATGGAGAGTGGGAGSSSGGTSSGGGGAGGTAGGSSGSGGGGGADGFVDLFNGKDLTGWTPGPTGKALFAVDSSAGEPAIHVYPTQADQSNQDQASLRTNDSFSSYVLHVEYKWGFNRFGGRTKNARDNGICWHVQLPLPNNSEWPTSIELQLGSDTWPGDWVSGNIFMLVNKTRAQWPYTMMGNNAVYSPTSTTKKTIGANGSYEKALSIPPNQNKGGLVSATGPATEWNVVELTVHGSTDASYSVNGVVVNGVTDMKVDTGGGTLMPLDHGPIALQAEFAETYFRNIKIKVLP